MTIHISYFDGVGDQLNQIKRRFTNVILIYISNFSELERMLEIDSKTKIPLYDWLE
ncbi:hypothetical protein J22TS1_43260 [Siminovitchia terrae]|nr:hypothetical protein J22TS1_43260 [Siminovitchia terrae]